MPALKPALSIILSLYNTTTTMFGRPLLAPCLRLALRPRTIPPTSSRPLHTLPRRPLIRPHAPFQQPRRTFAKDSTRTVLGNARILYHAHPIQFTLAITVILCGAGTLVYINHLYRTYIIGAYHNFPEPVAKKLRRAIYFTKTDLQPNEAVKYYRQALQVAEEVGMDPMGDEVMGVKIEVAGLMERIGNWEKAIEVLERMRGDNLKFLELYGDREGMEVKRTRVLGKTVAVCVKLAEHYSNPAIWDRARAEERLVWAVETVFREKQRRDALGLKPEELDEQEGQWMSDDEIGAATEALAGNYVEKGQHYLAVPLFLQCLNLKGEKDCHSVTLMSNLASSLAQQSPKAARAAQAFAQSRNIQDPDAPSGPMATRESMVQNAQIWAQKALSAAREIKPPLRTEECDVGCVVATHNLGELAEMLGDTQGAMKKYQEAVGLARAVGFQEGVETSSERLRELKSTGG
ncbi:uncharacterized protein LTR77_009599 [Saxophila tyrrhenica]|uniref:Uncharacterized protein n=1 Tax=Saxophila tyrrhenica TaxID=1690608 RepID=A0AAV9P0V4_9PEZI|nr:hypothetical protein LTR77_009599 [Saxophila tyrrhenica]